MSGLDPNGAGVLVVGGGSSLPTAAGAGEIPVSSGAGTTYVATGAAGVRTAIGAAGGSLLAAPLASGQGWTIAAGAGTAGSSAWTYVSGDKARCTLATSGTTHGGDGTDLGPRIERALPSAYDTSKRYKISLTISAASLAGGGAEGYLILYLRDGSGNYAAAIVRLQPTPIYICAGYWGAVGVTGTITSPTLTADGATTIHLVLTPNTYDARYKSAAGTSLTTTRGLVFTPTHFGVMGGSFNSITGYFEVQDLTLATADV